MVFFKPGTRPALNDLLIGDYEEIGETGIFDLHLAGQNLTVRVDGQFFVDNETGSVWSILGEATEGLAGEHSSRRRKFTRGQASLPRINQM